MSTYNFVPEGTEQVGSSGKSVQYGVVQFKLAGTAFILTEVCSDIARSFQQIPDWYNKLHHYFVLPLYFHFILRLSSNRSTVNLLVEPP